MQSNVNIVLTRKNYDATNGRMTYKFPTAMRMAGTEEVAVVAGSFYNSFFNVSAAKGTNTITLSFPIFTGATYVMTDYVIALSDGFYSITQLNQVIQAYCAANGLYLYDAAASSNVYFASLEVNSTLYASQVNTFYLPTASKASAAGLTNPASLPLNTDATATGVMVSPILKFSAGMATILGFTTGNHPAAQSTTTMAAWNRSPAAVEVGTLAPNVNPVTSVLVACNFAISPYSVPNNLVGQIPVIAAYGAINHFEPGFPLYAPVQSSMFHEIVVEFYDQNLTPLLFKDQDITMTLQVRSKA